MQEGSFHEHLAIGGVLVLLVLSGCGAIGSGTGPGDGLTEVTIVENTDEIEGVEPYDGSSLSTVSVADETVSQAIDAHERGDNESTMVATELDEAEVEQVKTALEGVERRDPEGLPSGEYYATEEYYVVVELMIYD